MTLWADHPIRQGRERILIARYRKGDRKKTSKGQESRQARDKQSKARLGKAKPGYAGQRADVGGAGSGVLGVLGPEVQELGVQVRSRARYRTRCRTICCVGREGKTQRGKQKSLYTQSSSPNLGYHLSGFTNIMITNVTIPNHRRF